MKLSLLLSMALLSSALSLNVLADESQGSLKFDSALIESNQVSSNWKHIEHLIPKSLLLLKNVTLHKVTAKHAQISTVIKSESHKKEAVSFLPIEVELVTTVNEKQISLRLLGNLKFNKKASGMLELDPDSISISAIKNGDTTAADVRDLAKQMVLNGGKDSQPELAKKIVRVFGRAAGIVVLDHFIKQPSRLALILRGDSLAKF